MGKKEREQRERVSKKEVGLTVCEVFKKSSSLTRGRPFPFTCYYFIFPPNAKPKSTTN
jgi:hypothetical protein